jgi:hypothetical protein
VRLALVLFILPTLLWAKPAENSAVLKLFEKEIQSASLNLKFEILPQSYARFEGALFGSGRYRLLRYTISPLGKDVYRLQLRFLRKKDALEYSTKVVLYFWQGKERVVFLTAKGKREYQLPPEAIKALKTDYGFLLVKENLTQTWVIPVKGGEIFLRVKRR